MSDNDQTSGAGGKEIDFVLYYYEPALAASITSTVVFAILTALHIWRLLRAKAYYFTAFTVGGLFQVIGYAFRIWGHFNPESVMAFAIQGTFILVAPALFAASIYMILGRLIRTCRAEHLSLIPVNWVTRIFVLGDVIAFTVQASGAGLSAAGDYDLFKLGEKVIIGGLFVQIVFFGFFVCTSVLFQHRLTRSPTPVSIEGRLPWKRHLYVLYGTSAIILVRSIFRVVEYIQGNDGYLITHEVYLYIFDALLMAAVMAIFVVWYVGDLESKKKRKAANLDSLHSSDEIVEMGRRDA
ncbi:hypothetical protein BN1708_012563 [Verticillium longisporum]|uniref:RTA1 like protein n=1 Tax=Verticillium longisporum TaxID=100787 RepID=A0A0G4LB86_VERLO|nr:hypothetical protein BN1708_012563 [Verticillium longisporum]